MDHIYCAQCGGRLPTTAKFCNQCGSPTASFPSAMGRTSVDGDAVNKKPIDRSDTASEPPMVGTTEKNVVRRTWSGESRDSANDSGDDSVLSREIDSLTAAVGRSIDVYFYRNSIPAEVHPLDLISKREARLDRVTDRDYEQAGEDMRRMVGRLSPWERFGWRKQELENIVAEIEFRRRSIQEWLFSSGVGVQNPESRGLLEQVDSNLDQIEGWIRQIDQEEQEYKSSPLTHRLGGHILRRVSKRQ